MVWQKCTNVSEVHAASIITLLMEAAGTFGISVNFYQTMQCNKPVDSHLYTPCHENLKSQF
jgi:hypothetical protein